MDGGREGRGERQGERRGGGREGRGRKRMSREVGRGEAGREEGW